MHRMELTGQGNGSSSVSELFNALGGSITRNILNRARPLRVRREFEYGYAMAAKNTETLHDNSSGRHDN